MPGKNYDRRITRPGPGAAALRFAMSVPGQILVNTAAFRLPEELRIEATWAVLDIGCGRAGLTRVLAQRAQLQQPPVGVDPSAEALELARRDSLGDRAARVRLVQGSTTALPLADDQFNFIMSGHTFKHLNDEELRASLIEARRVLKPGGIFLAWEIAPTRSGLLNRWNRWLLELEAPIERLRDYRELRQLAYDSGFDYVQSAKLRPFLLPPVPRVSLIMGKAPDGWRSAVVEGRRVMEPADGS